MKRKRQAESIDIRRRTSSEAARRVHAILARQRRQE
jgi:hypothetical protein